LTDAPHRSCALCLAKGHVKNKQSAAELMQYGLWSAPAEYREAGEYQEIPDVCQRRKTP